jgi:hypothetical protein
MHNRQIHFGQIMQIHKQEGSLKGFTHIGSLVHESKFHHILRVCISPPLLQVINTDAVPQCGLVDTLPRYAQKLHDDLTLS